MGEPLIIENLRKSYGSVDALAGVDLEVGAGEIVALLGPNGAGKTTLVSIVAALLRPDSGQVRVSGIDPHAHPQEARRHLGLAPQETGVYPVLSARENLRFFGGLGGLEESDLRRRVEEVAEAFELSPLLDRQAQTLSGGQRRRLHTAMALMHNPSLLLLDEPTAGVDVEARAHLMGVVRGLADAGAAILYSTHYLAEVEELNASVAILDRGRIIARDSLRSLIRSHGRPRIELVGPNLESVYLAMTGRPFAANGASNGTLSGSGDARA
jgi:ABC-2 type transport system ATP-binding protein